MLALCLQYTDVGVVYTYSHKKGSWSLQSSLTNWTTHSTAWTTAWANFGRSCSLNRNGSALIVGAPAFSPSDYYYGDGSVLFFSFYRGAWELEHTFER